jgi:CPA1 family monovalent cation:H+ antiporter
LKVLGRKGDDQNLELQRIRVLLVRADRLELEKLQKEGLRDTRAVEMLSRYFEVEQKEALEKLNSLDQRDDDMVLQGDFVRVYRRLLLKRKEKVIEARNEGLLSDVGSDQLLADIDAGLLEIASQPEALFDRMSSVKATVS